MLSVVRCLPVLLFLTLFLLGQDVRITEFMARNNSAFLDEDGESSDWIELHNVSGAAVNLAGWHLSDDAMRLFESLGFQHHPRACGVYMPCEESFKRVSGQQGVQVDLHWRASSRRMIARCFDFDTEWQRRVDLGPLGFGGFGMASDSALLLAICHYAGHLRGERRPIWDLDILLWIERLDPAQRQTFWQRAKVENHGQLCAQLCRSLFETHAMAFTASHCPILDELMTADAKQEMSA